MNFKVRDKVREILFHPVAYSPKAAHPHSLNTCGGRGFSFPLMQENNLDITFF